MKFFKGLIKFLLGLVVTILLIIFFRVGIRYVVWNYGIETLYMIYGLVAFSIILILVFYGYAQKKKKDKLIAEGKWIEPKVEKPIINEPETPKPNTKVILSVGLLALILVPGIAILLRSIL